MRSWTRSSNREAFVGVMITLGYPIFDRTLLLVVLTEAPEKRFDINAMLLSESLNYIIINAQN